MQCSWFDSGYIFGVSLRVLLKEDFLRFHVTVNLNPEVDSRFAWKSRFPRAPCIWQSLPAVLMRPVYEGF